MRKRSDKLRVVGGIVTSVAKERDIAITLAVFTYGLVNEVVNV